MGVSHVPLVYNLALLLEEEAENEEKETTHKEEDRVVCRRRAKELYVFLVKRYPTFRLPYFRLHALAVAEGQERQAVSWLTLLQQVLTFSGNKSHRSDDNNNKNSKNRNNNQSNSVTNNDDNNISHTNTINNNDHARDGQEEDAMARAQIAHLFFRARRYRGTVELLREGHYLTTTTTRPHSYIPSSASPTRAQARVEEASHPPRSQLVERNAARRRRDPVTLALAATYLWCSQQRSRDDRRFLARAKELFISVLRHDKGNLVAAHGLACCLGLEGDADRCQSMLNRVGEVTPTVPGVLAHHYGHMANVKMLSESYRAAMDYLTRMPHGRTPSQTACLAFCLASQNRYTEAMAMLEQALQSQGTHDEDGKHGGVNATERNQGRHWAATAAAEKEEQRRHIMYNLALVSCAAFLHRVATGGALRVEDGRALRTLLERGLSMAARVLREASGEAIHTRHCATRAMHAGAPRPEGVEDDAAGRLGKSSTAASASAAKSSSLLSTSPTMRVCLVFLKSVCAYALRVYENTVEQLLRLGKEAAQEQSRDAQRWADTFAHYRAEMAKEESQRDWRQRQGETVRAEIGREVLQAFRARRARDPLKLFDPDLIQASLAELAREEEQEEAEEAAMQESHAQKEENDKDKDEDGCDLDADDVGEMGQGGEDGEMVDRMTTDAILAGMQLQQGALPSADVQ